ncbi:hypothetical protein DL768_009221 [Monosporascus sp. mg162]|nr:hypothetical protein DL768_009221 [Monosporascus sp. mg162]
MKTPAIKSAFTTDLIPIDLWTMDYVAVHNISDAAALIPHRPLVRYGQDVMHIPEDGYGNMFKYAGNNSRTRDVHRTRSFPRFSEAELVLQDEEKANRLANFLDVNVQDPTPTTKHQPALGTEAKSTAKMNAVEEPMGKDIQNYLMAKPIRLGGYPAHGRAVDGDTPLARPGMARHSGDEFVLRPHPELDMESAMTPKELEEQPTCIIHYEMGAEQGHQNPKVVYRPQEASPQRRLSEARHLALEEYEASIETFSALPTHNGNGRTAPNLVMLFAFGAHSFTEWHRDRQEFASLVPLGDHTDTNDDEVQEGDLCFPQLGLKVDYKPGGCVVFRGAELEHFVETGTGPAHSFSEIDMEKPPEGGWTDADIHGAGTWDPAKNAHPMALPTDESSRRSSLSRNGRVNQDVQSEPTVTLLERRYLISGSRITGFRTWEGSLHLASYLLTETGKELVKGKEVLELGAGTGFLSILCAKHLQASHVTTTDGDEGVVGALKENIVLNGLRSDQHVVARTLRWGDDLEATWVKEDCMARPYDLVIGADITYDKVAIRALVTTIHQLFELRPGLRVLISGVVRNVNTFESFRSECLNRRFSVEELGFHAKTMRQQKALFYAAAVPIKILSVSGPG